MLSRPFFYRLPGGAKSDGAELEDKNNQPYDRIHLSKAKTLKLYVETLYLP